MREHPTNRTQSAQPGTRSRLAVGLCAACDLLKMSQCLQAHALDGVLATEGLDEATLAALRAALSRRHTVRHPLHPLLDPAAPIRSLQLDHAGRHHAMAQVADWLEAARIAPRHAATVDQALDELLSNALYDAPRDGSGMPRYQGVSVEERPYLPVRPGEQAEVRVALDEHRIVLAVADPWGALRREQVLTSLVRCALAQAQRQSAVEHKTSGNGVGLFLVALSASELFFRLRQDRRTEVIFCLYRTPPRMLRALIFDTEPRELD